jgi:predicted nuclease of predicted toxin-antitoxin system
MSLRFQLDEHIAEAVALGLRRRGIDVLTAHEAGLRNTPDEIILARAHAHGRLIVTHDQGFLRMHAPEVRRTTESRSQHSVLARWAR